MKVLGIVGSPRRGGNTEIMMTEALAAAKKAGAETEMVLLEGKHIQPCDGCQSCLKTFACKIKDDMQQLYKQMESADAIIWGSPVYFHSVTAQTKAVMDRTFAFLHDHRLRGKVAAPILALRRVGAGQARTHLYGFFLVHDMIPVRGAAGYGGKKGAVATGAGAGRNITALEEARNTGQEVVGMLQKLLK